MRKYLLLVLALASVVQVYSQERAVVEGDTVWIYFWRYAINGMKKAEAYLSYNNGVTFDSLIRTKDYWPEYPSDSAFDSLKWIITQPPGKSCRLKLLLISVDNDTGGDITEYPFEIKFKPPTNL